MSGPVTTGASASMPTVCVSVCVCVCVCVCVLEAGCPLSLLTANLPACGPAYARQSSVMRLLLPRFFSWPCPCVVMLMSPRHQKHPPPTPPLIVLFDLPLILLIRSPTFKVKRFACTSKSALCMRVCVCVRARDTKMKWHKEKGNCHLPPPHLSLCELQGPGYVR